MPFLPTTADMPLCYCQEMPHDFFYSWTHDLIYENVPYWSVAQSVATSTVYNQGVR